MPSMLFDVVTRKRANKRVLKLTHTTVHIIHTYICVCNIHIFTCTVRELGEREKETGMPPWAGPGTGRETRAGFLVRLDS